MILQTRVPYDVLTPRALPGIQPLGNEPWFLRDEVYPQQMAHRCRLIAEKRADVIACQDADETVVQRMLDEVLRHLPSGFEPGMDGVICPDGRTVPVDRSDPFGALGHILQDDICLLEKRGDEHVLTGAVLCFPASWRLREKIGHPLTHIHTPVRSYDADMALRVQRLFDGVRVGHPLWRFNALWYDDPELHQPRAVNEPRPLTNPGTAPYLRTERQVLWRVPDTDAVLFTIHTFVLPRDLFCEGEGV
jgi:dimethylamine monooxygenase subunit A